MNLTPSGLLSPTLPQTVSPLMSKGPSAKQSRSVPPSLHDNHPLPNHKSSTHQQTSLQLPTSRGFPFEGQQIQSHPVPFSWCNKQQKHTKQLSVVGVPPVLPLAPTNGVAPSTLLQTRRSQVSDQSMATAAARVASSVSLAATPTTTTGAAGVNPLILARAAAQIIKPAQVNTLLSQSVALQQHLHRMIGYINFSEDRYHPTAPPVWTTPRHGLFPAPRFESSTSPAPSSSDSRLSPQGSPRSSHLSRLHSLASSTPLPQQSPTSSGHKYGAPAKNAEGCQLQENDLNNPSIRCLYPRIRDSLSCPSLHLAGSSQYEEKEFSSDSCLSSYEEPEDLSGDRMLELIPPCATSALSTPSRGSASTSLHPQSSSLSQAPSTFSGPHSRESSRVGHWESLESLLSEASSTEACCECCLNIITDEMKRHHDQLPHSSFGAVPTRTTGHHGSVGGKRNRNLHGGTGGGNAVNNLNNRIGQKHLIPRNGQDPDDAAFRNETDSNQFRGERDRELQGNGPSRLGSGTATGGTSSNCPSVGSVAIVTSSPNSNGIPERFQEDVNDVSPNEIKCHRHLGSGDAPPRLDKKNQYHRPLPSSPPRPNSSPASMTSCPYTLPGQTLGPGYEIQQHRVAGSVFKTAIPANDNRSSSSCPSSTSVSRDGTPTPPPPSLSPHSSYSSFSSSPSPELPLNYLHNHSQQQQQPLYHQHHHLSASGSGPSKGSCLSSGGPLMARTQLQTHNQQLAKQQQQQQRHRSEDAALSSDCKAVASASAEAAAVAAVAEVAGLSSASSSGCSSIASSPSPPFSVSDRFPDITREMVTFYEKNMQTHDLFTKKMQLRQALYNLIRGEVFPYCGLYVVGSSMNGFGSMKSDMDICLMICQQEVRIDQHREAPEILRLVMFSLKKCAYITDIELIRAKVPILKFRDKISGVECDLNVNNSVGIRNTHLLSFYSKTDWRVRPLVMTVKNWAKRQQIGDASRRTISSYSLELMTIHFLQAGCTPAILPCLQREFPHLFEPNSDVRQLTLDDKLPVPFTSKNSQTLGELFLQFLEYYSETFNYDRDAISIRMGRAVPKEMVQYYSSPKNSPHMWKSLCIEEPFDHTNTARSVYDPGVFGQIKYVFRRSREELLKTGDLESVLQSPYVPFEEQVLPPF